MAKQQKKADRMIDRPAFKGFVNFSLNEDQKAEVKASQLTLEGLDDMLTDLFKDGYKVFWSWDFKNEVFLAALTNNDISHVNAGKFLNGRGSTPLKAVKQVLWAHHNLFPNHIWPLEVPAGADLDD